MFGIGATKESFIKSLKPGDIVKQTFILGVQDVLFEFGHYDESTTEIFWQTAIVVLGKTPDDDVVTRTGVIRHDKIYEQQRKCLLKNSGKIRHASQSEIKRYEDAYDSYMTMRYHDGQFQRSDFTLRKRDDGRLTMLQLLIDPPTYVYVECDDDSGEFIFKSAGLSYTDGTKSKIMCKEMFMDDDRFNLVASDELSICEYRDAKIVREASESEMKILLYAAEEKKKEEMMKNKLPLFSGSFKPGDIMYAEREHDNIIFQYDHHQRIEGIEQIRCKDGVLKFSKDKKTNTFDYYGRVGSYDSLLTFRLADESEKTLFLKEREYEEERRNKIHISKLITFHPGTLLHIELKSEPDYCFLVPYASDEEPMKINYCIGYYKVSKSNPIEDKTFMYCYGTSRFFASYEICSVIREADDDEKISFMCHYKFKNDKMSVEELRTLPEGVMLTAWYDTDTPNVPVRCTFRFKELSDTEDGVYIKYFDAVDYIHRKDGDEINVDMLPHDSSNIITMNMFFSKCYRSTQEEIDFYNKYIKEKGVPGKRIEINEIATPNRNGSDCRFKPFVSKVLVSNGEGDVWRPAVFGCVADGSNRFMIVGGQEYKYCVLYQKHRDLLGRKFKTGDERF